MARFVFPLGQLTLICFLLQQTDVSYNDLSGIGGLKHDPIREAILNFMLGQEVHLERFKSLADKKLLLSKALELSEGNAILAVSF